MLRHALVGLAAATLLSATIIPDDAFARGGGGRGGGGGARGAVGVRGGAVGVRGGAVGVRGAHVAHPIARAGAYRGARWGVGAAAVGAAAAGAAGYYGNGYYGNSCYRDGYGQLICPNQYQYGY